MNILVINQNAGSIEHGMEFRPYTFAREWTKAGHKVSIVGASYSHYRQKNIECAALVKENIEGIDYVWLPVPKYTGNGIDRVDNMKSFAKQLELYKDYFIDLQPTLVIDSSNNPLSSYCCYDITKQSGAKYIVELHDPWELLPMELDNMAEYNSMMHEAELFRCGHADKILTSLPKLEAYLEIYGLEHKKCWYIPNGVSLDEFGKVEPLDEAIMAELQEFRAKGKLLIGYAGTLDAEKALDVLLKAVRKAPDRVQFVILGDGQEKEQLMQIAEQYALQNVVFFGAVPKTMVPSFLKEMDWLYAGWRKNDIYRYGISNSKITEYMFASKPIIHSISADNDLVKLANCGISVPAEDVNALVAAIEKVEQRDESFGRSLGQNGRDYVANQLDYRAMAGWYLEVCRMGE